VGGELIVTPRSASGTDRGNAAAKRSDQAQQEQRRVLRRVALAWSRRARDEHDERCNSPRNAPQHINAASREPHLLLSAPCEATRYARSGPSGFGLSRGYVSRVC
jgi:hypothetical protein